MREIVESERTRQGKARQGDRRYDRTRQDKVWDRRVDTQTKALRGDDRPDRDVKI